MNYDISLFKKSKISIFNKKKMEMAKFKEKENSYISVK
jgi:hypothetical protein